MQYWYSGQTRRYILQIVRLLSNFSVKQSDGTLIRVPVMYGDMDRQVASIINQNSENTLNSAPRISVYITDLQLSRERLCDATFVGKAHIRERQIENGVYTGDQGLNYTVERLMPTPFDLTVKVDIWSSSTDQKLQILEQILMFFNPSLEIQTSDNFVDWTSLSVVDLEDVSFTSRTVPVGTGTQIDIASLRLKTPIWISPPAKVKKMGIITSVIATLYEDADPGDAGYIDGLGVTIGDTNPFPANPYATIHETIGDYDIIVTGKNVLAISNTQSQRYVSWYHIIDQYPGNYRPGLAKISLIQPDGTEVVGYGTVNVLDENIMSISDWDPDTFPTNTLLPGIIRPESAWGSFDAVIDPLTTRPPSLQEGTRYLIVNGIGGGIRDSFITDVNIEKIVTGELFTKVNYYTIKVDGIEVDSEILPNPVYYNISTNNINSLGSNATFDITLILYSGLYTGTLVNPGSGYNVNDKLKIRGNILGGNIIDNDCYITIKNVDINGSIIDFKISGTSVAQNFTIVPTQTIPAGSTVSYELFVNIDGPDAWKNADGSDFIAEINDIIEYDGQKWHVIFEAAETSSLVYQTNLHTMVQYKWNHTIWTKSFEGEYRKGQWRISL